MKKTIAAILVTILASAGYVVLDKASADKIDLMASQISSQQAVINRLETATYPTETTSGSTEPSSWTMPTDPLEMWTGCTLRCYPNVGTVVQAYVLDLSRVSEDTTTTTTTTATSPVTPEPTTHIVLAQQGEPTATTATTIKASSTTKALSTTTKTRTEPVTPVTILPTSYPFYRSPDYYFNTNRRYYYPTQADVYIQYFDCTMNGKTMTGVPVFVADLFGRVDPSYTGRQIVVWFGDSHVDVERATATIQANGSFRVSSELTLANPAVIPLSQIRID